jgi:EAL domain-containing protein (putative c-di-GMP-specific phosphodiesterase class I)
MSRVVNESVTESELQRAVDCGELIRLYQPIVELPSGVPRYVEALLRWDHPDRGLLAPAEFLADEDDSALLVRIGWSVMIEAVHRAGEWRQAYPDRPVTVSMNVSAGHLSYRGLSTRIAHLLDNEVPGPNALALEISERHLGPHRRRTRDRLLPVRNLGVEIVIDDFGASACATDDSAEALDTTLDRLESLRDFPVDVVKLDPRFVRRLGDATAEVVAAAQAVDLRVVALAVEDDADAQRSLDAGFDLAQGFFFHRPERPANVDGLLASR